MKFFYNFDYFRKSQQGMGRSKAPSLSGGFTSLLCIFTILILIWSEIDEYRTPYIEKSSKVATDPSSHPHISINLDMTFKNMPCMFIEPSIETAVNFVDAKDIIQNLTWAHVDASQNVKQNLDPSLFQEQLTDNNTEGTAYSMVHEFFENQWNCRVKGTIDTLKVTSQLTLKQRGDSELFRTFLLYNNRRDEGERASVQMNHRVNSITFGDASSQEYIASIFGSRTEGFHTLFNTFDKSRSEFVHYQSRDLVKETLQEKPHDYYYYLKVVPHDFNDEITDEGGSSYSYSLNHNHKSSEERDKSILAVIFDFAPIKVIISRRRREFGTCMVNVCAILSGVSIICGLLNQLLNHLKAKED